MYKQVAIIIQMWHRAYNCHFTSMNNAWHLITVPNMNKITTLVSQQTLKIDEKIVIITQIWHKAKFYVIYISGTWYLIMVSNMKKIFPAIMEE